MLCPHWDLLNPGAAPAVLPQHRRKHPSAQRFVRRPLRKLKFIRAAWAYVFPHWMV
jgi:hypothetical protein